VPDYRKHSPASRISGPKDETPGRYCPAIQFLDNNPARFIKPGIILNRVFLSLGYSGFGQVCAAKFKNKPAVTKSQPKPSDCCTQARSRSAGGYRSIPVKRRSRTAIGWGIKTRENCGSSVKVDGKRSTRRCWEKGGLNSER